MSWHLALCSSSRPPLDQQQFHVNAPLHCDQPDLWHQQPVQTAEHRQVPSLLRLRQWIGTLRSVGVVKACSLIYKRKIKQEMRNTFPLREILSCVCPVVCVCTLLCVSKSVFSCAGFDRHRGWSVQYGLQTSQPPGLLWHQQRHHWTPWLQTLIQLQVQDEEQRLRHLREGKPLSPANHIPGFHHHWFATGLDFFKI